MARWTDGFVGDRMAVDREFGERVAASEFSSQEWGTIMTAVDLEIERPESPEDARLVADTSKVDQVMPALEQMRQSMGAGGVPGGGGGTGRGSGGGPGGPSGGSGATGGGLFDSIKRTLGLGGSSTDHRAEAAAALADEYARQFQEHLEERGKWEQACAAAEAAAETGDGDGGFADEATDAQPERRDDAETGDGGDTGDDGDTAGDGGTGSDGGSGGDGGTDEDGESSGDGPGS